MPSNRPDKPVGAPQWSLDVHTDKRGDIYATLREPGKMDTVTLIYPEQLPWLNALRWLLRNPD